MSPVEQHRKFLDCASRALGEHAAGLLYGHLLKLDEAEDLRTVAASLGRQ
jgi:hypothetical protein